MARPFELLVLTPPGLPDPSIAIAASRAGEWGVLDLEYTFDEATAVQAMARMARYANGQWGIKLDSSAPAFVDRVVAHLPEAVKLVILTPGNPDALQGEGKASPLQQGERKVSPLQQGERKASPLRQLVPALQQRGLTVLLEVTCLEQARLGEELGADGLIAKGHEAGGWVGEETTFILLQRLLTQTSLPVWAQGGIGLHTAAACYAAGAAGVVLDSQLALTRESPLPEAVKASMARMDGSETACLGVELGQPCRMYVRPGLPAVEELRQMISDFGIRISEPMSNSQPFDYAQGRSAIRNSQSAIRNSQSAWRQAVSERVGWDSPEQKVWLIGQDGAFAASLARRFYTVGGVLQGFRQAIHGHVEAAQRLRPLDEGSPLARSHSTRYPIVQGPMTRVSDRAEFALRVAEGGALPFLALALMRAPEVEALLKETRQLLGDRPWGVGILGFVPLGLRQEQLEVIRQYRPPFALIAGGRPDQARALEKEGIPTYLHVPSPGLLQLFLKDGARRFVFEGRECGGHVGPRSSFVLWNTMIDVLLEELPDVGRIDDSSYHVLFAGGIHDALSASMVAAMAAPLAERGVRVGVLLGTSYLFTEEAVASGAILPGFQQEALHCDHTVLLETGPGHVIRCVETPYAREFEQEKRRLLQQGKSAEEVREALEALNVGRLRIASKGIDRHPRYGQDATAPRFVTLNEEEQRARGMYMIGQLAALRDRTCTMAELHHDVAVKSSERLAELTLPSPSVGAGLAPALPAAHPCDIAIIGMACLLPKAGDLQTFWENILGKVNAITEVPPDRWDWRQYYDPDRKARDKIYSRWGGFLDEVPFDPTRYGIPPNAVSSIEPIQLLTLGVVRAALEDAGYLVKSEIRNPKSEIQQGRHFPRERTSVILGAGGGMGDLGVEYGVRATLPKFIGDVPPELLERLPEWTEDSFPGILLNVIAGRVANCFDLGGVNYVVDAACASSLAAVYLAVRELEMGSSDMVIAGGVDNVQNPFAFTAFSKTQALSPRGQCRTFDDSADGIAISEGLAIVVLKRLADAERDGDRIYAVIKGIAGSSDGRGKSLTAPRPEGQARALERAYQMAGISPATVGLIEAHGTGTVVGDQAEVETLKQVFGAAGAARQSCAIGSVKSMIGHTKCAAGVAGLIKVVLALHHKVLPPTLGVERPNSKVRFEESPFYVNTEPRPWLNGINGHPRRAGVSAFGFGGTNFHAVVEEYTGNFLSSQATAQHWPSELFVWSAPSRQELISALASLEQAIDQGARPELADLAYTLYKTTADPSAPLRTADGSPDPSGAAEGVHLAIVATSLDDLRQKLEQARQMLTAVQPSRAGRGQGIAPTAHPAIYFTDQPLAREGKVAFLFPGQGSQYPNMLRDLAIHFSEVREQFERADQALIEGRGQGIAPTGQFPEALSRFVFPPPAFSPKEERAQQEALTQTNVAQPALGAADMALFHLLQALGVRPDLVAGHSYGEYVALCAAGAFNEGTLATLSEARGRCIIEAAKADLGTMAAVQAGPEPIAAALASLEGVWIANLNAPQQTIISGTRAGVEQAVERLKAAGMQARPISVACAFHSPIIAPAQERFAEILSSVAFAAPQLEVFSNTTAGPYPRDPQDIVSLLAEHLVRPVRFADEIEAMYQAGARIFVEVGPRNVLTSLTRQILGQRPHVALAVDAPGRPGLTQLQHVLGQLAAQGVPVRLERLFQGRKVRQLNLNRLVEETAEKPLPPTTWLINGGRARPVATAEANRKPQVAGHRSQVAGHRSQVAGHRSQVAGHKSQVTGHESQVAGHKSQVTGHESQAASPATGDLGPASASSHQPSAIGYQPAASSRQPAASIQQRPGGETAGVAAMRSGDQPVAGWSDDEATRRPGDQATNAQIMLQFQHLMDRFLETQKNVMLAYLQGGTREAVGASAPQSVAESRLQVAGHKSQVAGHKPALVETSEVSEDFGSLDITGPATGDQPLLSTDYPGGKADEHRAHRIRFSASDPLEAETVTTRLLAIVSERTGYPTEMLDLDLDIEAELGIDSIKRVEILGRLRQSFGDSDWEARGLDMEKLSQIKTLRGIIDRIADGSHESRVTSHEPSPPSRQILNEVERPDDGRQTTDGDIHRFILRCVDRPVPSQTASLAPGGVVLITDDETGVAHQVASQLRDQGHPVVLIRMGAGSGGQVETSEVSEDFGSLSRSNFVRLGSPDPGLKRGSDDPLRANLDLLSLDVTDLTSPAAIEQTLALIRENHGPVAGLVHLLPLRPWVGRIDHSSYEMDLSSWRQRLRLETQSLFLLARALGPDLEAAALAGGAVLLAATAMGGTFASDAVPPLPPPLHGGGEGGADLETSEVSEDFGSLDVTSFFPGHGAIAGLLKTAAREWPHLRVKAVDLNPQEPATVLAEHVLAEIMADDGQVEVGYRGSRRLVLELILSPLPMAECGLQIAEWNNPKSEIRNPTSDWVVLVTGGARGITAEVALELAERYQPTLLLVGRSPQPEPEEAPDTAGLSSPHELKAALMDRLRADTQVRGTSEVRRTWVAQVEKAYNDLLREREIRHNLEALRQAGARVHYYPVDVRDEGAFGGLIEEVYRTFGRLDGVIHGAGIIEDKLLKDKTPESFDRVFSTKVESAFILSRHLRPDSLRFLAFFSSVAGRFGNRGQGDYAAANEVLNKLAVYLNRRWPGRVVSINWGPWEKRGMVSPEVRRQFDERGIQLVPPSTGRRMFNQELRYGRKSEVEVVVAGGTWDGISLTGQVQDLLTGQVQDLPLQREVAAPTAVVVPQGERKASPLPLLQHPSVSIQMNGAALEVVRTFDPSHDLYLRDHLLDGKPVLPVAMVTELVAEVVQQGWPDLEVVSVRDLQLIRGVILENGPKTVRLVAQPQVEFSSEQPGVHVHIEITDPAEPGRPYYRATVELADQLPEPPPHRLPIGALQPFPKTVEEAYRQWLFQGPLFQGLTEIHGISQRGMVATCRPSSPRRCLTGDPKGQWLIDPVVFDSGLQLIYLWTRVYTDMTPLPSRFRRYQRFGVLNEPLIRCHLQAHTSSDGRIVQATLFFVGPDGRLSGVLEDWESVSSKALNRLGGGQT